MAIINGRRMGGVVVVAALCAVTGTLVTATPAVAAHPTSDCAGTICTVTFAYTGGLQSWSVPAGVTSANFDVLGAAGGAVAGTGSPVGGLGGESKGTVAVSPGDLYFVYVGGKGLNRNTSGSSTGSAGGFNGGGPGGGPTAGTSGASGGGASDIRTGGALSTRLLVAGGGGGAADLGGSTGAGGAGGGVTAGAGKGSSLTSGGGGGGYYGGGGGGYDSSDGTVNGPGGGGSSYASAQVTNVVLSAGVQSGNGEVVITYSDDDLSIAGVPSDMTTSADSSGGATVSYTAPIALDPDDPTPPPVSCAPASGSIFPIGSTTVTCSATDPDDVQGTVSATFTVTVNPPGAGTGSNEATDAPATASDQAVVVGATDVHTGKPWAGSRPVEGALLLVGTALTTTGLMRRRRNNAIRRQT